MSDGGLDQLLSSLVQARHAAVYWDARHPMPSVYDRKALASSEMDMFPHIRATEARHNN